MYLQKEPAERKNSIDGSGNVIIGTMPESEVSTTQSEASRSRSRHRCRKLGIVVHPAYRSRGNRQGAEGRETFAPVICRYLRRCPAEELAPDQNRKEALPNIADRENSRGRHRAKRSGSREVTRGPAVPGRERPELPRGADKGVQCSFDPAPRSTKKAMEEVGVENKAVGGRTARTRSMPGCCCDVNQAAKMKLKKLARGHVNFASLDDTLGSFDPPTLKSPARPSKKGHSFSFPKGYFCTFKGRRKKAPLIVPDGQASESDLESVFSHGSPRGSLPSQEYLSDEEFKNQENSLLPLYDSSEDETFDVLPSPRVSPDMSHIPDVVVISDHEETSEAFDRSGEEGNQVTSLTRKKLRCGDYSRLQNNVSGSSSDKILKTYKEKGVRHLQSENLWKTSGFAHQPEASSSRHKNFLSVPRKHLRRVSSGSLTSGSDESEGEPSPPLSRRGRRSAIYDSKNFGDVSPSTLSPELSPCNSCDEGEGGNNLAGRLRRRRSSVDIPMSVYPGDLLVHGVRGGQKKKLTKRNTVADFATRQDLSSIYSEVADSKKGRQTFSLLKLMKTRSKESLTQLEEMLGKMKPSEFRDNTLIGYKNLHWSDLIAPPDNDLQPIGISAKERKRREAVWELFKSEVIFLIDHLMVLKHCFMEPLKKVQVEGHLMFAEPQYLFGNLDEICYVSYTFCKDFLSALLKGMSNTQFGTTAVLIKAFQRFSAHSRDGDVYHTYCLNYMNAMTYLENLRRHEEFCEFEKWCEQDQRCNRLQLPDLLVAPIQHCTKLPLLLGNIRKYTEEEDEKQEITESIQKVEKSLNQLEDKMKWLKNYERVREIHQQLVWPSLHELDPRVFVPEFMKHTLNKQPCEKLLTCPKRQLIYEGQLALLETAKTIDAYVFLFDDILLITKHKKSARKKQTSVDGISRTTTTSATERGSYVVYRQPIALDRLILHDVTPSEAITCALKHTFVVLHISRFQQVIGVYSLQANNDVTRVTWVNHVKEAKEKYSETHSSQQDMQQTTEIANKETMDDIRFSDWNTLKCSHANSKSMDAVHF